MTLSHLVTNEWEMMLLKKQLLHGRILYIFSTRKRLALILHKSIEKPFARIFRVKPQKRKL